jgi:pimeloyl-ACP methyl ester carboxylesterase
MYPAHEPCVRVRFVRLPSGTRIRVVESGPDDGAPVLLLHGWGASIYGWRYVLRELGEGGYHAIAFDLKGHGLSDKPLGGDEYTLASMRAHVLEAMSALDIPRAAVIGHSMGGRIAAAIALSAPERVRALALLAPAGIGEVHGTALARLPFPFLAPLGPELIQRWMIEATLRACYGRAGSFTPQDVDEYWAPSQFVGSSYAALMILRRFDWRPIDAGRLAALGVPLLVVRGTLDRVVWLRDHGPLARRLPAGALLVVKDAGHLPHEEVPMQVLPPLRALLAAAGADRRGVASAVALNPDKR